MSRCQTCQQFICERCQRSHKRAKNSLNHQFISLDDYFKSNPNSSSASKNRISHCSEHPHLPIDSFCKTCMISICSACAVKKHPKHDFCPIEDVVPEFIKSIKNSFIGVSFSSFFPLSYSFSFPSTQWIITKKKKKKLVNSNRHLRKKRN